MPNVVRFPGELRVADQGDPGDENVRWAMRCECGSIDFRVYHCGEIACVACDTVPHDPLRGDVRAHWTAETALMPKGWQSQE
jgi:hypothetical protein